MSISFPGWHRSASQHGCRRRQPLQALVLVALWASTADPLPPAIAQQIAPSVAPNPSLAPSPGSQRLPFVRERYNPAILRLSFSTGPAQPVGDGQPPAAAKTGDRSRAGLSVLDIVLILPAGDLVGKRVEIPRATFANLLRQLYSELSRQASLDVANPESPSRQLHQLLIAPIEADLQQAGITTLLISLDSGLQAIPLSALHDGSEYFGVRYAFSLTPSLGLMPLAAPPPVQGKYLLAGSSRFNGLAPLPLVPQEVSHIGASVRSEAFLDASFTPQVLLQGPAESSVSRVHVATHAEFMPGGPQRSRIYSGTEPVSLAQFSTLRQRRQSDPMDLFVLSACRTALGDSDSELGFAGLALQAGSRSAVGSLWYVDDVATSAFFIQFYEFLRQGVPKAEALQMTRRAFASGQIHSEGSGIVGADSRVLLSDLTPVQQRRIARGLSNPYFWAGIQLLGTPW